MSYTFFHTTNATLLCLLLFVVCIIVVRLGRFVRNKYFHKDTEDSRGGVNTLLGGLFGLWGLVLAFTFGNSSSRMDNIVSVMVDEYSAIRNAIFRAQLFPDSLNIGFRDDLNDYIKARIDYYHSASDKEKFDKVIADTRRIGKSLWTRTQRASALPNMSLTANNMFTALTSMFDLASKRDALLALGVSDFVFYMLFLLAIIISFVKGFSTHAIGTKEWVVIIGFILLACTIINITLDLNRPTEGFIKPKVGEERMEQLQRLFLR